jgi:hypothetical protein
LDSQRQSIIPRCSVAEVIALTGAGKIERWFCFLQPSNLAFSANSWFAVSRYWDWVKQS